LAIKLPPRYVDDLPPAANADCPFAGYPSRTEVNGKVLRCARSVEEKQLAVPLDKMAALQAFLSEMAANETRRCSSPPC